MESKKKVEKEIETKKEEFEEELLNIERALSNDLDRSRSGPRGDIRDRLDMGKVRRDIEYVFSRENDSRDSIVRPFVCLVLSICHVRGSNRCDHGSKSVDHVAGMSAAGYKIFRVMFLQSVSILILDNAPGVV